MKFTIKLKNIRTIEKIEDYWQKEDYINLLELFDYPDATSVPETELFEMLSMAISDFEPDEAAEIVLTYKLSNILKKGQIENLSHEMLIDKVAEDYADISLHYPLFNINQLLYSAFNGTFPHAKATKVGFELSVKGDSNIAVTKELALKAVCGGLADNSPILRLFEKQLNGKEPFSDAEKIVWELHDSGSNAYTMITSDYWINKEDFIDYEFAGSIKLYEDKEE